MDDNAFLEAIGQMMDSKLEPIRADLSEVKQRVTKIEVVQENTIAKQINLLVEGHGDIVKKLRGLDVLTEKVDDIQDTVEVLKRLTVKK